MKLFKSVSIICFSLCFITDAKAAGIPLTNISIGGPGGTATNAIANNNGKGTNTFFYGTINFNGTNATGTNVSFGLPGGGSFTVTNPVTGAVFSMSPFGVLKADTFFGKGGSLLQGANEINVLDYGAIPAPCEDLNDGYDWTTHSNECGAALQAAFVAAGRAGGNSNAVYLPPGIYMTTNISIDVPGKVNIRGAGVIHGATGTFTQSGSNGGYSLIWFRNSSAMGLRFTNQHSGVISVKDFEVVGYTNNPLVGCPALQTIPSSSMANVGIQVYDDQQGWCGGWNAERVGWHGFKIGLNLNAGQSILRNCYGLGNDIAIVNLASAPPILNLSANGLSLGWVNTHLTNYLTSHDGQWVAADNTYMEQCNFGMRSNGVLQIWENTRSVADISPTHYNFATWAIIDGASWSAHDAYLEDQADFFRADFIVCPNVTGNKVTLKNIQLSSNTSHGTNVYGESYTNQVWIHAQQALVDISDCSGLYQLGPRGSVFLKDAIGFQSSLSLHGTTGYREAMEYTPRMVIPVYPDGNFNSWYDNFFEGWGLVFNNATNLNYVPVGKVQYQLGNPDYMGFWGATASTYPDINSGDLPALLQRNYRFYKLLQSDEYDLSTNVPQQSHSTSRALSVPDNYTVDELLAHTNITSPVYSTLTNSSSAHIVPNGESDYSTNGTVILTGMSGYSPTRYFNGTKHIFGAGSARAITVPASWTPVGSSVFFVTNETTLTVSATPGRGTNVICVPIY